MKQTATISLGDGAIFDFVSTKVGWTKAFYRIHDTGDENDVPVFTAAGNPVAYVPNLTAGQEAIAASLNQPVLSVASNGDGSAGRNLIIHDRPFYISNDRIAVRLKNEGIDIQFIKYQLRTMSSHYGFDFTHKVTKHNLMSVNVEIPLTESSDYDLERQRRIVQRHDDLRAFQEKLKEYADELRTLSVSLTGMLTGMDSVNLSLADSAYFELEIGERKLQKDLLKKRNSLSSIPVFSANVVEPFGYCENTNLSDLDVSSVIWGIDGIFDWSYMPAGKLFEITDHCGRLKVQDDALDVKYISCVLKESKNRYGFDRTYRASLSNVSRLVTIDVPVGPDGEFDLSAQKEIAERYSKIDSIRATLSAELTSASRASINLLA